MPFQNKVNYNWSIGFPGAIASANGHRSAIGPQLSYVAGAGGCTIGAFGWVQSDGQTVLNKPQETEAPTGFVLRDQSALITGYLAESTMLMPPGFPTTLVTGGDYFAISTTAATAGQAVYASTTDGSIRTGAAGTAPEGTITTGWVVTLGGAAGNVIIISGAMAPIAGSNE